VYNKPNQGCITHIVVNLYRYFHVSRHV